MAASNKDTIYVDIDDEITGIIDKVHASKGKIIALVLPKRAAVFQSIVNMKLLKRAADSGKKNLVLITSEAGLLPLAGAAGIHVAKTLNSKPEIPISPSMDDAEEEVDEDEAEELPDDEPVDKTAPIGKLAGTAAAADGVETLVLDDEDVPPEADDKKPAPKTFVPPKKNKKLSVPDFDRFRLLLILGGLILFLLIVGFIVAAKTLPKATISIKTDASALDVNADLNLSTTATKYDDANSILPAKLTQQQKTYTQQVPTTGQKNNGNKASGSVTVTNCTGADASIPAGTGFSSGGNTFISQQTATIPDSNYKINGDCKRDGKASVNILAQSAGTSYNLPAGGAFTLAGESSSLSGQGNGTSGGTDSIVQSVNQNDINSAKNKIQPASDSDMKKTLKGQLNKDNLFAIESTYSTGTPAVTSSAQVGEVANNVTVTEVITYTMFGVHKNDLESVINSSIKDQIDTSKQSVLDDGIGSAAFNVDDQSATGAKITMSTTASVGPDLNVATITENAKGKKPAEIRTQLETNPDVKSVDVKLSPFWVSSVPGKASRIKVDIAKPTSTKKASSSNGNNQ